MWREKGKNNGGISNLSGKRHERRASPRLRNEETQAFFFSKHRISTIIYSRHVVFFEPSNYLEAQGKRRRRRRWGLTRVFCAPQTGSLQLKGGLSNLPKNASRIGKGGFPVKATICFVLPRTLPSQFLATSSSRPFSDCLYSVSLEESIEK